MYKGAAFPLLVELARDAGVRKALYGPMLRGLKDEKIALAGVLARSGDKDSIAPLKQLANDPDPAVSAGGGPGGHGVAVRGKPAGGAGQAAPAGSPLRYLALLLLLLADAHLGSAEPWLR